MKTMNLVSVSYSYSILRACQVQSGMSGSPGGRLSTWQLIAASCPTTLGALCCQLTFRLAWCRKHSAVTATELLQPLDLACRTLLSVQLRNLDITHGLFRRQLKGYLFREARTRRSVTSDMRRLENTIPNPVCFIAATERLDCLHKYRTA